SLGPGPSFRYGGPEEEEVAEIIDAEYVKVYPNPTTGEVTIILPEAPEQAWNYTLNSLAGTALEAGKLIHRKQVVNFKGLSAGMFYLRIFSADVEQRYSEKIVIQKE
ncbi:MAG: T9SS type A sorting domain-containing protein, partial [Flavobacteriales bacterium]|nr:T9SS type A sorting domain-containing protein [Flavobacteriales bacterium]